MSELMLSIGIDLKAKEIDDQRFRGGIVSVSGR